MIHTELACSWEKGRNNEDKVLESTFGITHPHQSNIRTNTRISKYDKSNMKIQNKDMKHYEELLRLNFWLTSYTQSLHVCLWPVQACMNFFKTHIGDFQRSTLILRVGWKCVMDKYEDNVLESTFGTSYSHHSNNRLFRSTHNRDLLVNKNMICVRQLRVFLTTIF